MIKATDFIKTSRCLNLGDFVFAPMPVKYANPRFQAALKKVRPKKNHESIYHSICELTSEYVSHNECNWGQEPGWTKRAPAIIKQHLRRERLIHGVKREPFHVFYGQPYEGISFVLMDEGPVVAIIRAFNLMRLQHIGQLGYLHPAITDDDGRCNTMAMPFPQTRYDHSINVAALLALMAHNCNLKALYRAYLRFVGLTHDALTPAGGDSTKIVDRQAFDEDANYSYLLNNEHWERFARHWRLKAEQMKQLIAGQGPLGQMFKLADKIAYTARDTEIFIQECGHLSLSESFLSITRLLQKNPLACSIWDCVRIIDNQLVITNPKRLADWLKLRALVCKHVYYNPKVRVQEVTLSNVVTRYLYETGQLTKHDLLTLTDFGLEQQIDHFANQKWPLFSISLQANTEVYSFDTAVQAYETKDNLKLQGIPITAVEKLPRAKPLTQLLTQQRGKIVTFEQAMPETAAEITEICDSIPTFATYGLTGFELNDNLKLAIEHYEAHEKTVRVQHLAES